LEVGRTDEAVMSKAIDAISRSADVQARLIEDLVDVSRIAAGKLNLHWESVDLRAPVETSVEVARAAANAKGIRTTVRMPSQPCPVRGDVDRLRQVVGNLLSNAVKFGKTGGTITVVLRDLGGAYEIQVSDDGVGIVPEMLPQVFDRYRQADSSTTRRHDGLGLGLSIVKEVTELHGGSVAVSSGGPGQGATFYLRVPKLLGTRLFPEAGEQNGNGEQVRLDGVRVLAVDDNEDALDVLSEALRAAGASVSTATSGPEALSAWEHDPPDILLCDLAMPDMDGYGVVAAIRERDERERRHTAAIAISAHATPEHRQRSFDAGFSEHVTKPYRFSELLRAVNDALDLKP
jgi:CheY-like chemotaxis protein